jgi:hypothetical protein
MTSTRPVESGDGYTRPESSHSRIADQLRKLPRSVNGATGRPLPPETTPDPTVSAVSPSPTSPPSGSHVPVPTPPAGATSLERIADEARKHLDLPLPAGYVPSQ